MLGPSPPIVKSRDVPPNMQIVRQRFRPGSGFLSVKILTDGPTRVLQISDIKHQVRMRARSCQCAPADVIVR